ncbi:hypothetical protein A8F94_14425 [Bacillus sp. FJAT-27225]|uniref:hypothetical protein n=1 Tax=Bacillus sp. FJAT-27225 TaxID=1743144 RepID=UPI00080C279B|nr:hypothetical protein [Bacillus sp. FJAT-27225]OCA86035.1 hypothetical protein A8F94_14425 [Bacillus sp. FJAT-27225]
MPENVKLSKEAVHYFVGREEELHLMRKHAEGDWDWTWLHIFGQGGIGKTSLLTQFRLNSQFTCFYIDGNKGVQNKEDFLHQLDHQIWGEDERPFETLETDQYIQRLLSLSTNFPKIILLIDGFEKMRLVEEWLMNWLGDILPFIPIITAGRHPLTWKWRLPEWASLIYSFKLSSLTPSQVSLYALKRGILPRDQQLLLSRFSGGIPLAMALTAEVLVRGSRTDVLDRSEQNRLISVLMDEITRTLPEQFQLVLEASSVYWRFNEDRLAALVDISTSEFRELTQLPFVKQLEDGWVHHDAVRAWIHKDLISRKPHSYEKMRRKALHQIRMEEQLSPNLEAKLRMDKMFLHEHPIVRNTCCLGNLEDVEIRECLESNLPAVELLYLDYLNSTVSVHSGDRHLADLIRPIWELEPSSFFTIWRNDRMIAFYAMVPLVEKIVDVLGKEPLLQPFFGSWSPVPNTYLLALVGVDPDLEEQTRSSITDLLINHFSAAEWILDFTCQKEWFPVFELLGFERAAWADAITALGTEYRAYTLDLRTEDFLTKLDRRLSGHLTQSTFPQTDPETGMKDLKKILKGYHSLPSNQLLCELYRQLFPHRLDFDGLIENVGRQIQKDLLQSIEVISKEENGESILGQVLKYTYIHRIKPQELVARRLNISLASYYRYLQKALTRLFDYLVQNDHSTQG